MLRWVLILMCPLVSHAANIEYICQFDKPLPMLKKIKDTEKPVNITGINFIYSQNGFSGYVMKAFFVSGNEKFALDDKMDPIDLVDKGFTFAKKRKSATETCVQKSQENFAKASSALQRKKPVSRQIAQERNPAQEAVNVIQAANRDVQKPNDSYRTYSQLQNNDGQACLGFRCNTNPKARPVVQNNAVKLKPSN